jgi:5-oxoprolinase (ATP-hydrolysing)
VGFQKTTSRGHNPPEVVGFDMGGTSTDVSRVHGDEYSYVQETELDGVFIQATQLDINTVAAGGGSVLHFKQGNMDVGPDSVGSDPGM